MYWKKLKRERCILYLKCLYFNLKIMFNDPISDRSNKLCFDIKRHKSQRSLCKIQYKLFYQNQKDNSNNVRMKSFLRKVV